jgi:hypothetical protein
VSGATCLALDRFRKGRLLRRQAIWRGNLVALPFVLVEAAWAFALLVAPLLLVAIAAFPVAIWSASRAIVATVRGEDPRRWVAVFSLGILIVSVALLCVLALRLFPRSS